MVRSVLGEVGKVRCKRKGEEGMGGQGLLTPDGDSDGERRAFSRLGSLTDSKAKRGLVPD